MTRTERGSATLHTLFAAVLLFTALTAAVLWSAISTARHKLTAAADLTALSAAQSLGAARPVRSNGQFEHHEQSHGNAPPATPCATAARVAVLNKVQLTACVVASDAVTVEVSVELDLRLTRPTLTAAARAGPL
ncbi:putative Flp pilus-assembly TadE/G-like protein [Kribbella sp. VKM Ac-2569]|nr:putative Flp pilus-assembly TadE/G-like protein [Kribbella sp. VKM Ac-2569]